MLRKIAFLTSVMIFCFSSSDVHAQSTDQFNWARLAELALQDNVQPIKEQLDAVSEALRADPDKPTENRQVVQATSLFLDGKFLAAAEIFRQLSQSNADAQILVWLARSLAAAGNLDQALETLAPRASQPQCPTSILTLLSSIYCSKKNFDQAMTTANRAVAADATHADAYFIRAMIAWKTGDFEQASSDVERGLIYDEAGPFRNEGLPYLIRAGLSLKSGNIESATTDFETALKFESDSIRAMYGLWQIYGHLKNTDKLSHWSKKLASSAPNSREAVHANAVTVTAIHGIQAAESWIQKWVLTENENAQAHYYQAKLFAANNDLAAALTSAESAMELDSTNISFRDLLARLTVKLAGEDAKKIESARNIAEQICKDSNWKQGRSILLLATIEIKLENYERAAKLLDQAETVETSEVELLRIRRAKQALEQKASEIMQ